jgi:DNA polymerase-3 subunit alpha
LLAWEKELLNLYLSAHPLAHVAQVLKRRVTTYTSLLNEEWAGQTVTLGGRIASIRPIVTKKGQRMAAVQLEDLQGTVEVVVFPKTFGLTAEMWRDDAVVLVTGTVKLREEEPQLVCDRVEELVVTEEEISRREYLLRIRLVKSGNDVRDIVRTQDLLHVLHEYPGEDRFELVVPNGRWIARLVPAAEQEGIRVCPQLQQRIEELLGPGTVEAHALPAATAR